MLKIYERIHNIEIQIKIVAKKSTAKIRITENFIITLVGTLSLTLNFLILIFLILKISI